MKIPGRIPETSPIAPTTAVTPHPAGARGAQSLGRENDPQPGTVRRDQVQISTDARDRVAALAETDTGSLSAERIAELRQRLASGAYDTDEAIDALAPRVLDHPEL